MNTTRELAEKLLAACDNRNAAFSHAPFTIRYPEFSALCTHENITRLCPRLMKLEDELKYQSCTISGSDEDHKRAERAQEALKEYAT